MAAMGRSYPTPKIGNGRKVPLSGPCTGQILLGPAHESAILSTSLHSKISLAQPRIGLELCQNSEENRPSIAGVSTMQTNRQMHFKQKVAQAARNHKILKSRGRPMPRNLSNEGSNKGLEAMRRVPRCQSKSKDGQPCKSPAMRRATKCIKHGGRVQVPGHGHNIERFMSGKMRQEELAQEEYFEGRGLWETMRLKERSGFLELIPEEIHGHDRKFFACVKILKESEGEGYQIRWKALDSVRNGHFI